MNVKKQITLAEREYKIIYEYARKHGFSFSDFLRKSALNYIQSKEESNEVDLLDFFNANLEAVSEQEYKELEEWNLDLFDLVGEELNSDDI